MSLTNVPCRVIFSLLALAFGFAAQSATESSLRTLYPRAILPYWNGGSEGSFRGVDSVRIAYRRFGSPQNANALVVVPGRSEPAKKYAEFVYDLREAGYTIYVLDLRGQGRSGRLTKNLQVGHVREYSDYVDDLLQFNDQIVKRAGHTQRFLVAHSLGGAIAALALERAPSSFRAAALVAPMFSFNSDPMPKSLAYSISASACALGQGQNYAMGKKDWQPSQTMGENSTTSSQVRYDLAQELFAREAELRVGGPSYQWVREAIEANTHIQQQSWRGLRVPLLILDGGKDNVVHPKANRLFCSRVPGCREYSYPDSLHGILNERDAIRSKALRRILNFFAAF